VKLTSTNKKNRHSKLKNNPTRKILETLSSQQDREAQAMLLQPVTMTTIIGKKEQKGLFCFSLINKK